MPDTPDTPVYRHVQTYWMLWVILLATGAVAALKLSAEQAVGSADALGGLVLMAASLGGALLCLGRLVIEVRPRELRWHFGYVGWPGWSVSLEQVTRTEVIRTSLAWGSGIRGPQAHRLYNVTLGGPALMVHLLDGRSVTLGTPEPQRLQDILQAGLPAARH
jgi:hypothetical protein